ncbi:MAG: response regulator, partial [Acidobacteriaceae bacterium]|nr:response regulator [Acidobacteriaceae bacterium]
MRQALQVHELNFDLALQRDGEAMLHAIEAIDAGDAECPDLVLLDLNLPKCSGAALLERLRTGRLCARVPVIVVTSSDAPKDREAVAHLGANAY